MFRRDLRPSTTFTQGLRHISTTEPRWDLRHNSSLETLFFWQSRNCERLMIFAQWEVGVCSHEPLLAQHGRQHEQGGTNYSSGSKISLSRITIEMIWFWSAWSRLGWYDFHRAGAEDLPDPPVDDQQLPTSQRRRQVTLLYDLLLFPTAISSIVFAHIWYKFKINCLVNLSSFQVQSGAASRRSRLPACLWGKTPPQLSWFYLEWCSMYLRVQNEWYAWKWFSQDVWVAEAVISWMVTLALIEDDWRLRKLAKHPIHARRSHV